MDRGLLGKVHELQWGHERALVEISGCKEAAQRKPGFNGATSARSWKSGPSHLLHRLSGLLQWGHERALVEIWRTSPWTWIWPRFNGADRKSTRLNSSH